MEFNWTFTSTEARTLYGLIASVVVPFVVSLLKRADWPAWAKVLLAVVVSVIGACLSEYAAGTLDGPVSVVMVAIGIFTASQAHFATWFQSLGAEQRLTEDKQLTERMRTML